MRSVKSAIVAATAALFSTAAFAADMPSIMPPPPPMQYQAPVIEDFGGWYLRGDIGVSRQHVGSIFNVMYEAPGIGVSTYGAGFDGSMLFGLGAGYQFNAWLRADITGEYRSKASFHGLDIVRFNGAVIGTDEYRASKSDILFMANLYADLGTWWCITPFIGVGVGANYSTIASFVDINTPNAGVAYAKDYSKFSLAYAVHAGLGYKVTNNLTIELAYRYLNLGDAQSGDLITYTGINTVNNPMEFRNIDSHDLKLGVRWQCCEPPAPAQPVLMRRG